VFGYKFFTYKSYGFFVGRLALMEAGVLLDMFDVKKTKKTMFEAVCFTGWLFYTNIADRPKSLPVMLETLFDIAVCVSTFSELEGSLISRPDNLLLERFKTYNESFGYVAPPNFDRLHEDFITFAEISGAPEAALGKMYMYHMVTVTELVAMEKRIIILW
jgi:hypothetical protein